MLEQILAHLRNWFCVGVYPGTYTVENGSLALPFLQNGQYFRIIGSVFNDGVYQYPAELKNETFRGTVWALAVPQALISLSEEIESWNEKQGRAGPFVSESFAGYSYTKATNSKGMPVTWQDAFGGRLNEWRKV